MENNLFNYLLIPEIFFTILILLLILIGLFKKNDSFKLINLLSFITLFFVFLLVFLDINISSSNYNYFFINNYFINFFKLLIIFGCFSSLIITKKYFIDVKLISFEIPILILFSCLGMMIMISSNNLISMYLGIELQSLALYVLAAIKRDSLQSSESGVKYFILGALSSGILLYGCSLIYGFTGTTNFSEIYNSLLSIKSLNLGLIFGLVFVLVGLAFKVSAVPFHMWTPDVYEGAPTSITAFFAIVPKISAVVLIYRFCMEPFYHFYSEWSQIIIFLSIASMFLGAIAAIAQKNIKRLLAYSSIGHVGYILIGVAAANEESIKGISFYLSTYVIMNIAVFIIILSLKNNNNFIEKISDYAGLSKYKPLIALSFAIVMLSMAGIPPFAGFFAKFYIFVAALKADLIILAILGVISSVISAFYYLKIIKIIYFDDADISQFSIIISRQSAIILALSIIIITFFIFYPSLFVSPLSNLSNVYFN